MTSNFDDDERALNRALHGHVDPLQASPLGLGDVQAKARVVRRNRRIAAAAAVAAAVAVVVPTALVATRGTDSSPDRRNVATQSAEPTATEATDVPSETPIEAGETQPFDLSSLEKGDDPKIDWADGRTIHRFDGTVVADILPEGTVQFAPMGDGFTALTRDDGGNQYAQFASAEGMSTQVVYDATGDLATSPLGEVVAWATPEGGVQGFQMGGEHFEMQPVPGAKTAVAVTTEDCKEGRTTDGGCTIFVNTDGEARFTSSHGIVDVADVDMDELTAWSEQRYAGIVERNDDMSTCSVVKDSGESRKVLWETCDNRIMDFSPTGATALGVGSIGDGLGDGQISLIDSATGTVLVDMRSTEEHQVTVHQYVWEDDSHVLLLVTEGFDWSVVRLGVDGSMEYAVEPREGVDNLTPEFLLQTIS
jgi:hypothetical protein